MPILHFRADRFLYLPAIGFVWALFELAAIAFERFGPTAKPAWCVSGPVVLALLVVVPAAIRTHVRSADFSDDLTLFTDVVATHPECREAQGWLADALLRAERAEEAIVAAGRALTSDERYVSFVDERAVRNTLGVAQLRIGDIAGAHATYQEILARERDPDPEVLFNFVITSRRLGYLDEAVDALARYLEQRPDDPDALYVLGDTHLGRGDAPRATTAYARYLEVLPQAPDRDRVEKLLAELRAR